MKLPASCRELLKQMVGIESINEHHCGRVNPEAELASHLESICRAWDLPALRLDTGVAGSDNLLIRHQKRPGNPWLLFESHLDTVGTEGMTIDPFGGHIDGSRMYGRGTCDTKGSGAAMLWALSRYAREKSAGNNVALLFTVDEEATKRGISSFVDRHLAGGPVPPIGFTPVGAVVGEPTSLKPVVAHCGVARWAVRTHGVAAHSSDPTRGRSAIRIMMRVIEAIESQYVAHLSASHPLTGPARCSINMIRGGTAVNIVPDSCDIWVDRRVVPGEDPAAVVPEVVKVLEALRTEAPGISYSILDERTDPPLDPAGNERFVSLANATLRAIGLSGEPVGAAFGSDASTLSAHGIPALLLGPGDIAQAHSCSEYVELTELDAAVDAYYALMCSALEDLQ